MPCLYPALLSLALLLGGCAAPQVVDSEVRTFSSLQQLGAPPSYSFERLPSQQAQTAQQDQLEAVAEQSLRRVGMLRTEAQPRFMVRVDSRVQRLAPRAVWGDAWGPWGPWGWNGAWGPHGMHGRHNMHGIHHGPPHGPWGGPAWGWGPANWAEPTLYLREVELTMREVASQQVVYETRAVSEMRAPGAARLIGAMLDAALSDFPQAAPAPRQVRTVLAPPSAPPPAQSTPTRPANAGRPAP